MTPSGPGAAALGAESAGSSLLGLRRPELLCRLWVQVCLVLLVCVAVYWVRLGADGFVSSEGHRVLPAWAMLDSGDYMIPRLFGQVYVRKPPGIFWAIAGASELLGRTEFAARSVSAAAMTLGAVLSLVFARRWFGRLDPMAGLVAGMAHALAPWFWQVGRVAEIESLHQLAVQASVLLLIDLLVREERTSRFGRFGAGIAAGLSLAGMALIKGPAGVPCIAGVMASACIVARSPRPLLRPGVRTAILTAALAIVWVFGMYLSAVARTPEAPVSQSLDEFLWSAKNLKGVALLLPTALGSALPLTFALFYPWGAAPTPDAGANRIAKSLAWTCILALGIYLACGVSNRRYALPAFCFLPPLAAFAAARICSGTVIGVPWPIARRLLINQPGAWFIGMTIFAAIWLGFVEPRRAAHGGRTAGLAMADAISRGAPGGAELWADDMVEARPDVLDYAARGLAARGRTLRVRWVSIAETPRFPDPGNYLALRTDKESDELRIFHAAGLDERTELVHSGRLDDFEFNIYRVLAP